jgi:hypothetical protein
MSVLVLLWAAVAAASFVNFVYYQHGRRSPRSVSRPEVMRKWPQRYVVNVHRKQRGSKNTLS